MTLTLASFPRKGNKMNDKEVTISIKGRYEQIRLERKKERKVWESSAATCI